MILSQNASPETLEAVSKPPRLLRQRERVIMPLSCILALKAVLPFQVLIFWLVRVLQTHWLWWAVGSIIDFSTVQFRLVNLKDKVGLNKKCAYTEPSLRPLLVQMNVRRLCQKGLNSRCFTTFINQNSNKSHWPLIIFTLLLLLHLQPLLLFWIQRAPTIPTLPHMISSFHSRSRIPFDSTLSTSPEWSPSW